MTLGPGGLLEDFAYEDSSSLLPTYKQDHTINIIEKNECLQSQLKGQLLNFIVLKVNFVLTKVSVDSPVVSE